MQSKSLPLPTAHDIMNPHVHALHTDELLSSATRWLVGKGHTAIPVIAQDGSPAGVLSQQDCLRAQLEMFSGRPQGQVSGYMNPEPTTVSWNEELSQLAERFRDEKCEHLLVVDEEAHVRGIISRREMLQALESRLEQVSHPTTYDLLRGRWRR